MNVTARILWIAGSVAVTALLILGWQLIADYGGIAPVFLPGPNRAWAALVSGFDGGELTVPNVEALVGERVRVRIRARDVSLAVERPRGMSILNVLPGTLDSLADDGGPIVEAQLRVGQALLRARITRRSRIELGLAEGQPVYALVKAVSLDRRSVGYA